MESNSEEMTTSLVFSKTYHYVGVGNGGTLVFSASISITQSCPHILE